MHSYNLNIHIIFAHDACAAIAVINLSGLNWLYKFSSHTQVVIYTYYLLLCNGVVVQCCWKVEIFILVAKRVATPCLAATVQFRYNY